MLEKFSHLQQVDGSDHGYVPANPSPVQLAAGIWLKYFLKPCENPINCIILYNKLAIIYNCMKTDLFDKVHCLLEC